MATRIFPDCSKGDMTRSIHKPAGFSSPSFLSSARLPRPSLYKLSMLEWSTLQQQIGSVWRTKNHGSGVHVPPCASGASANPESSGSLWPLSRLEIRSQESFGHVATRVGARAHRASATLFCLCLGNSGRRRVCRLDRCLCRLCRLCRRRRVGSRPRRSQPARAAVDRPPPLGDCIPARQARVQGAGAETRPVSLPAGFHL